MLGVMLFDSSQSIAVAIYNPKEERKAVLAVVEVALVTFGFRWSAWSSPGVLWGEAPGWVPRKVWNCCEGHAGDVLVVDNLVAEPDPIVGAGASAVE